MTTMVLQSANCGSTRVKSILSDGEVPVQRLRNVLTSLPPVILAMSTVRLVSVSILNINWPGSHNEETEADFKPTTTPGTTSHHHQVSFTLIVVICS